MIKLYLVFSGRGSFGWSFGVDTVITAFGVDTVITAVIPGNH